MVEGALARNRVSPANGILRALLDDALVHVIRSRFSTSMIGPAPRPNNAWWEGDAGRSDGSSGAYESLWLPASLLETDAQQQLADALFASSRLSESSCTSTRASPERRPMPSSGRRIPRPIPRC